MLATRNAEPTRTEAFRAVATLRADYPRWARRVMKILDKRDRIVPLVLKSIQRRMGEIELEELVRYGMARLFSLKGRQGGITTDQQGRNLHAIWSCPGAKCLTLTDNQKRTDATFEITRFAIEKAPHELLPRMGPAGTREISFPALNSIFWTGTAGATEVGRGLTLKRLHGSEFAFWREPKKTLNAAAPALERPGTTIVLETTAAGYGSEAHAFWEEAVPGGNGYRQIFFPWWDCDWEIYQTPLDEPDELGALDEEEQQLVALHGLTLPHLKWRRKKIREKGRAEFLQEYAEDPDSCWIAAGGMFYDADLLKALQLRAQARVPVRTELAGALKIYSELQPGEHAIAGSDTGEGTSSTGDRSTAVFRASTNWRLLATYEDRRVQPKEFAGILNTWGRVFSQALLVVEKNMHGITVLRHLRDDLEYPLSALYHRPTLDNAQNEKRDMIGWATTGESKPIMLDAGREFFNAARDGVADAPSLEAIVDAFGVRRGDDGKYDLNGKDMLVAEMLCWIGRTAPTSTGFLEYMREQLAAKRAAANQEKSHGTT